MEGAVLSSLVMFLLQPSHHTELAIIHDHTSPDLREVIQSSFGRWADTSLLRASPTPVLAHLQVVLRPTQTTNLRYLILLCSLNNTRSVFNMVSRYNLESRRVRWLVVGDEADLAYSLLDTLREGSMVGMAARVNSGLYKIYSSYVNRENQMKFQEVGVWRGRSGDKGRGSLLRSLFSHLEDLYRDFQGRQLVIAAVDNWPFFEVKYLEDGTVIAERGMDVTIINTLGYYLNFTYRVEVPADKQWGGVQRDGTVTGMVGEVTNRRSHLAIDEITILASRETVVDFSLPYFIDSTTLTSMAPAERNRSLAVFYPFSFLLWVVLFMVTLLMGLLGYLISQVHHQVTHKFESTPNKRGGNVGPSFDSGGGIKIGSDPRVRGIEMFCFNIFRTIIIQGNLLPASSWPLRLFFFSWYAFCVIVYAVYAGTLTAYLTKPSFNKPIDSLEDLLAARERGVVASVSSGTSNEIILKTATSGIFKAVYDSLDPSRSFATYGLIAIGEVEEKNTAYMGGQVGSEIYAIKHGRERFHMARNTFNPQAYGIACPSGALYIPILDLLVGRMLQAGLVNKWHKDEVAKLKKGTGKEASKAGVAVRPLALDHLQGAFYILGFGVLLAVGVMLTEAFTHLLM